MTEAGFEKLSIETERLCLRSYEPEDLEPLYEIWNDAEVTKYIRQNWHPTREDVAKYFEAVRERWAKRGFGQLAMTLKETGELIGYCGFKFVEETPEVELLYGSAKRFWGQGYMTEAARACLRYAYENTELDRIVALAWPENKGSWRVMEKVGMRYEKMAHHYNTDLVCYTITRDEFRHGAEPYVLRRT